MPDEYTPDGVDWRQALADRLASSFFPMSTPEDRRSALGEGISRYGTMLKMAGMSPDWRHAARIIGQAYGSGVDTYRSALEGIIKSRMEDEDRAHTLLKRDYELEALEEDRLKSADERGERERKAAYREKVPSQIGTLRSQFEKTLQDTDIDEVERGDLMSAFSAAVDRAEAEQSPEAMSDVIAVMRDAAEKAGESEQFAKSEEQAMAKAARSAGYDNVEEYKAKFLSAKKKSDLAEMAEEGAQRGEAARLRGISQRRDELNRKVEEAFMSGKPLTTPGGYEMLPDTPGIYFARPAKAGSGATDKALQRLATNKKLLQLAGSPDEAQMLDEETAGLLRNFFGIEPVVQDGTISIRPEDWQSFVNDMKEIATGGMKSETAAPPAAGGKTTTRAEIEAAAKKAGKSVAEVERDAIRAGYRIVG